MSKPEKFQQIVGRFLKTLSFEMRPQEYLFFFDSLFENLDNVFFYFSELLHYIISAENGKKILKSNNIDDMIATLSVLFSSLNIRKMHILNKKNTFPEIEKEWKNHKEKPNRHPNSTAMINNLFNFILNRNEHQYALGLIDQICLVPTELKVFLNLEKYNYIENVSDLNLLKFYKELSEYYSKIEQCQKNAKPENPALYTILFQEKFEITYSGESSFAYIIFFNMLNEFQEKEIELVPDEIIQTLIDNLKLVPFVAKKFPDQAEKIILNLLHLIKQIVTFFPLNIFDPNNYQETIKQLINKIEIFRRWAYPIGLMANELLSVLVSESKTLGSAFRYKFREDTPKVDFFYYNENQDANQHLQIAYCINEELEGVISGILNENIIKNEYKAGLDVHDLRLLTIAYIFNLHEKAEKSFLKVLAGLEERDIFLIYCRILNIIDKCEELDNYLDIKNIQEKALEEICNEIMSMNSNSNPQRQDVLLHTKSFVPKYGDYIFKNLRGLNNHGLKADYGYSFLILEMLEKIKKIDLPLHQEPFRFICFGGDAEFQNIVQDLGLIYKKDSSILDNIDFRCYIVPTKKNTLAKFLAHHDMWYCRNIYLPFNEDLIIPKLETVVEMSQSLGFVGKETSNFNLEKNCFPFSLKESLLQSYIREATKVLSLKAYEILCYKEINNEKDRVPDNKIYFCLYMELGRNVEFEKMYQAKKVLNESYYDLKDKGLIKFVPLDCEMETTSSDFLNHSCDSEKIKTKISNLKICNVYKEGFEGNLPIPNADWLELSYIDYENSRQEDYSIKQKNLFKKHTKEQIQNAFFSLHTSLSINKITIKEINNKGFEFLADGRIFGPYPQITVQPLLSSDEHKKHLSLPIMTFLPLNL